MVTNTGKIAKLLVRNRPLGHYILSVYSLLFRGYCIDNENDIITLIAPSRSIGRTTDLANILARVCAPYLLWLSPKRTKISNRLQRTKIGKRYPKVSNLIAKLTSLDRKNTPDDEGVRIDQDEEKTKALENYNKREGTNLTKEQYAFIEALMAYREKHPNAPREIEKLKEEFKRNSQEIQDEFFDRIVKATPSGKLLKKRAGESRAMQSYKSKDGEVGKLQKFDICELEFILSTLLKKGYKLRFTCPDNWEIELEVSPKEKKCAPFGKPKTDKKGNPIKDKSGNPVTEPRYSGNKVPGGDIELGEVFLKDVNIEYRPFTSMSLPITVETCHYVKSSIEAALMRMGLFSSPKLEELAKDMCRFDDVLIGLDTNCFYHGVITAALLDSFVGVARYPYLDTPNWITLVTSIISTGEMEHRATERKDYFDGKDTQYTHYRRIACRALQEFMEISTCADLEGVSMSLVGEIPPEIDFSGRNTVRDELMRKQIKNFLGNLDFCKGTYFLTEDRMCAMFARSEGLHAVHLTRKGLNNAGQGIALTDLHPSSYGEELDIHNVSELVYELDVEFPLKITCTTEGNDNKGCSLHGLSFIIRTDWPGKRLEEWENRNFMVKIVTDKEDVAALFYEWLNRNAESVTLGQLLWGWQQVNARHHEEPGFPSWAT